MPSHVARSPLQDTTPDEAPHIPNTGVHQAYDGSNILFRLLRIYGWGNLLNLGYFDWMSPFSLFSLPVAQRQLVRKTVRLLDLKGGERVLDAACGCGWSSSHIALSYPVKEVVGMDLLPHHVHICQSLYGNIPGLRCRQGDATAMPFDDHSFDAVICIEAAFHFDRGKFILEAGRVLRQGGRLVIVDFIWRSREEGLADHPATRRVRSLWQWDDFNNLDEYRQKAAEAGFTIRSLQDWTLNVTTTFYYIFRVICHLGGTPAGRRLLSWLNPPLRKISPAHWMELHEILLAHNHVRRQSRYMALTLEKR